MKTKRVYLNTAIFVFALAVIAIGGNIAINKLGISADTNVPKYDQTDCSFNFCNKSENYDTCRQGCAGKNASIQTGILFAGNRGVVSNTDLNFIAKQHKLAVFQLLRPPLASNVQPPSTNFSEQNQVVQKTLDDARTVKEISKSANPDLKVLHYRLSTRLSKWDLDVTDNEDWDGQIPESCFLHTTDASGVPVLDLSHRILHGGNSYMADPSSDCWKQRYMTYFFNQLLPSANKTTLAGNDFFDGVFMDEAIPRQGNPGISQNLKDNWDSILSQVFSAVKNKIKETGPNKVAMYNGIKCNPDIKWTGEKENCNAWKILNNPDLDGVMYEWFSYRSPEEGTPSFEPYDVFKRQLDLAIEVDAKGKMVLASNIVKLPAGTDIRSDSVRVLQRALLASYLLAQGDHTYYEIALGTGGTQSVFNLPSPIVNNATYNFVGYFPDWNIDIGKSTGKYQELSSPSHVFARDFEKALVLYNGDGSAKTVPLIGSYTTPEGQEVAGSITLTANQGQILLKNFTKAFCSNGTCFLQEGYNTVTTDKPMSPQGFYDAGMTVFGFGEKKWRQSDRQQPTTELYPGYGYYVYSPTAQTVTNTFTDQYMPGLLGGAVLSKGWNLFGNSSDQAKTLSELQIYISNGNTTSTCSVLPWCLYDLKTISQVTDKIYHKIVVIKDGTATDADKAFDYIELKGKDPASISIPAHTAFWVYLKD